jgi:hypothetical protein
VVPNQACRATLKPAEQRRNVYTMDQGMTRLTYLTPLFWVAMTTILPTSPCEAVTFRMTSKIYEGANLNASAEDLILFDRGLVFELPQIDGRFVTVYDRAKKEITLLDRQT